MDYITMEKWSSLEEIAEHLGVSKDTIYRWISTKQMPVHKVVKLWKFKNSEIDKWVTKGEAGICQNYGEYCLFRKDKQYA